MVEQQEENINWLNRLIEVCKDGNNGYKTAANKIEDDELKTILYRLSQQRALFEAELQNEVRSLGGKEEDSGTSTGTLHRAWMNVKEAFTSDDNESILEECKRGDKAAVEVYENALKSDLPDYLKEKVKEQFTLIRGAILQLDEFEKTSDN
jgi:uncharacterized protein (TIGR02284 family)